MKNKYIILFCIFIVIITAGKIYISKNLGLGDDEAHYWQYSRHIELSYYDHPPVIAYLIKTTTLIFGNTPLSVRIGGIFCSVLFSIILFLFIKNMYDLKTGFFNVILFSLIPVFFIGSIITIPDAPLSVFWLIYIFLIYKIINSENEKFIIKTFYVSGVILGLALSSKYNAILLPFCTFLLLIFIKSKRKWLFKKYFYISLIIAFIIFSPVFIWNLDYNFIPFNYQLTHGFGHYTNFKFPIPDFSIFTKNIIAQSAYISPLLFVLLFITLFLIKYKNIDDKTLFLLTFSIPVIFIFDFIGLFKEILPHWPVMGYIPLIILTNNYLLNNKNKFLIYLSYLISIILTLTIILHSLYSIIPYGKYFNPQLDITNELYGWKEAGEKIQEFLDKNNDYFILTHKHYIASQLAFYIPCRPKIFCINDYIDQYDFWQQNSINLDGKNFLFITDNRFKIQPEQLYTFKKYSELPIFHFYRKNKSIRQFYMYVCESFDIKKLNPKFMPVLEKNNIRTKIKELDKKIFLTINNKCKKYKVLDYIMIFFTLIGNGFFIVPIVGLILIFTVYKLNLKPALNDLIIFIVILIFGGIIIQILKNIFDLARPLKEFSEIINNNSLKVNVLLAPLKDYGFPSGHTYTAFTAATFLNDIFKNKKIGFFLFLIAGFVGISRIYVGAHFFTDVIGGGIIGFFYSYCSLYIKNYKQMFLKQNFVLQ